MSVYPKQYEAFKREYNIWAMMKQRCRNPKAANYVSYGAKGIGVSPEFERFSDFLKALGPAPTRQHTLDRIDNTQGYSPQNCRWADVETQQNNRTNGVHYTARGQTLSAPQWERLLGIPRHLITHRIEKMGMSVEDALQSPKMSWLQRPVMQKTLDGQDVRLFGSIAEVARSIANETLTVAKARQKVWTAVKRSQKYLGFYWAYVEQGQ